MVKHFRDLDVYQGAMSLVMEIFALPKGFPPDERYTLTIKSGDHLAQFAPISLRPGEKDVMKLRLYRS